MENKTLRFKIKHLDTFKAIIDGRKKVETRAASLKYREVKVGDILVLVCGKEKTTKRVKKVEYFKTIDSVLKKYKPKEIDPKLSSIKEARELWYSFPRYKEKIKKFGLVVWRLK